MNKYTTALAVLLLIASQPSQSSSKLKIGKVTAFKTIHEPSGVLSLRSGQIIVIGDEVNAPINIVEIKGRKLHERSTSQDKSLYQSITEYIKLGSLEDLEGIASDNFGNIYIITSHSKKLDGKSPPSRKKIVSFKLQDSSIVDPVVVTNLKKKITKAYPSIKQAISGKRNDLNIEAISINRLTSSLMVGLRTPLINDKAVVVNLPDIAQVFAGTKKLRVAPKPIYLDLDKGGIRSISYNEYLNGYLIISRREDKKDKSFKVWLWNGDSDGRPQRVRFAKHYPLDHAEGIAPIVWENGAGLMVVIDDGDTRRKKPGHYLVVPYEQLSIAGTRLIAKDIYDH